MGINWTEDDLKNYKSKIKNSVESKMSKNINNYRKNKYGNVITKIDGITFSSIKEAKYYQQLLLLQQNNIITGFCMQPTFILEAYIKYKPDFIVFYPDHTEIVEIKGYETQLWKAKKKLFEKKYPKLKLTIIR